MNKADTIYCKIVNTVNDLQHLGQFVALAVAK